MKRTLSHIALLAMPLFSIAQDLPAPSPSATLKQRIGLTDVTVEYSRPSMKGRKVFGDLVPYGEVWRTGANKATSISFKGNVIVNDQPLQAGSYSLFTIPHEGGAWELILNKNTELWGAYDRKPEEDVLHLKVPVKECATTETFTMEFANLGQDVADLVIRWENQEAALRISADATEQGKANIMEAVAKADAGYRPFYSAASFYLDRNIDAKQALAWAQQSVNKEKKYWNLFVLAKAQAANNQFKEASATAQEAAKLAAAEKDAGAEKTYGKMASEWAAKAGK
jgi:hypothetical protein